MTREERAEAIRFFETMLELESSIKDANFRYSKLALEALKQEPCEDCISREATVERLCKVAEFMNEKRAGLGSPYVMAALFIQDNKEEFPSVTPQKKRGCWIEHFDESGKWYECDQCHTDWGGTVNYCPNCGADMRGDANVNDK